MADKFFKRENGDLVFKTPISESAGVADAGKIVAVGIDGRIDDSMMSRKFVTVTSGPADAGKFPVLGPNGRLDDSMLPVGVGPVGKKCVAFENIAAKSIINFVKDPATQEFKIRAADATTNKPGDGYILEAVLQGQQVDTYTEGEIVGLTGCPIGQLFLGDNGAMTATAPTAPGSIVQRIAIGTKPTEALFRREAPVKIA